MRLLVIDKSFVSFRFCSVPYKSFAPMCQVLELVTLVSTTIRSRTTSSGCLRNASISGLLHSLAVFVTNQEVKCPPNVSFAFILLSVSLRFDFFLSQYPCVVKIVPPFSLCPRCFGTPTVLITGITRSNVDSKVQARPSVLYEYFCDCSLLPLCSLMWASSTCTSLATHALSQVYSSLA